MPQSVSVPEKTLEHWSSQYVTYRYNADAAQWWPAQGEDIRLNWLPARPGKAIQLELKTTTIAKPGVHNVWVDLGQLREYLKRPLSRQPFYVFPWPDEYWPGNLEDAATAAEVHVTELGFSRSGGWWFANWMVVMTTPDVARVLRKELKAYGSGTRRSKKRLVQFDVRDPGKQREEYAKWGHSGKEPTPGWTSWLDFWPMVEQCGRVGWPQLIRLPIWMVTEEHKAYQPREILRRLQQSADDSELEQIGRVQFVTLEADQDGNYRTVRAVDDDFSGSFTERQVAYSDYRQLVFLDARAFRVGQT